MAKSDLIGRQRTVDVPQDLLDADNLEHCL
jgi:hypothetical protein